VRHISSVNCGEINWDRPGEIAYEILSIERRVRWSKSRFFTFKEICARGHQRAVPHRSRYFAIVGQSIVKTVADRHGHATYHNKH